MTQAPSYILDEKERLRLRKLVEVRGVSGTARLLGLSRGVVSAAAGGISIRRGSIELVREALASYRRNVTEAE